VAVLFFGWTCLALSVVAEFRCEGRFGPFVFGDDGSVR
jgi:hypothetical protein